MDDEYLVKNELQKNNFDFERKWTVYIHIVPKEIRSAPDRDDYFDKYYVGITSQPIQRRWRKDGRGYETQTFWKAIQKYGWNNIQHEILATNLSIEEACEFEYTLVKQLGSNKGYGYNMDQGGIMYESGRSKSEDLTGRIFGKLTVLGNDPTDPKRVICQCSCDNQTIKSVNRYRLLKGEITSCGCMHKKPQYKHGMKNTRIYTTWQKMKASCYTKSDENYSKIGANGILVCDEWNNNFIEFYNWAQNNGYDQETTCIIDRIDKSKDFTPENCIFVTRHEKLNQKPNNHLITYQGRTQNITDWENEYGFNHGYLNSRIVVSGLSVEEAFDTSIDRSTLLNRHAKKYEYNNELKTIREWSEELNIDLQKLRNKVYSGKSISDAIQSLKNRG